MLVCLFCLVSHLFCVLIYSSFSFFVYQAACPEGYFKIPMGVTRSCFTVRNTPVTWDDALLGCALDNGTLASLESREEADLVVSLIASKLTSYFVRNSNVINSR